jgi:hypothetical protein
MKKGFPKFKTTDKKPPFKMEKPRNIEKNELQVEKEYEIEEEQEPERLKIEDTENVKEENKEKTEKEVHLSEDEMENPLLFDSRKKKDKK